MEKFDKLSIIIPAYNEADSLPILLETIDQVQFPLEHEVIVVDDGSTDGTADFVRRLPEKYRKVIQSRNQGKGAAIRKGFEEAKGDVIVIQDADVEYDPTELGLVIAPILSGRADVVYGSRFITTHPRRVLYFHHYFANRFLTFISNMFTGLNLSDMETGYKAFTRPALEKIASRLRSKRFGIEPELTAQIAKNGLRVYEVGVSYHGRTYEEGKKITWRDGLAAIWHIIRFNLFSK
ncbi:MAG TPA: glycosyltransferase family 2 protein [Candidatus Paceibacterota bacterium]|nr:glycosyltransferase family 2 protein [Candidatus Paceibacterota bacterium]